MKTNISVLKLFIKLLVFMILFVMLFMISAFLYSARYWPDIYNYVNANITIKRIPTISELNLTVIVVEYNTEGYSTTEDYDASTDGTNTEDYSFSFDEFDFPTSKKRRDAKIEEMGVDYSELAKTVVVDYFFVDNNNNNKGIIRDLIDESKLAIGLKYMDLTGDVTVETCSGLKASVSKAVFPWIATIYLRNDSKQGQFDYYCDGAIISESAVLTAARCVHEGNRAISASEFIVFAGKTSHKSLGDKEKVLRIKAIKTHENFTIQDGVAKNDLAILILEETLKFDDVMSQACLETEEGLSNNATKSVTTAWNLFGDLTLIYFDKEKSQACDSDNKVENTFCATYSDDVPLCPSYGGVYVSRSSNKLYLSGIRTGDPQRSGVCFGKDVDYTSLRSYSGWIKDNVFPNKDI